MTFASLDALVLCGGLGTRLRAVRPDGQKAMADIGERPFLSLVLDWLKTQGLRRAVLCVGHRADEVEAYFAGRPGGLEIAFSREPSPLGTAGALKNAEGLLRGKTTLVVNGDSLCEAALAPMIESHARRGAVASLIAVAPGARRDGGCVVADDSGRISAFLEKSFDAPGLLNAGIYLLEREAFAAIPEGRPCSLEREILPALISRGVYAHRSPQPLFDIGTPDRLEAFRAAYS